MRRFRLSLVGGPNCGSAILEDVETWPPPYFLYVKGAQGWYVRTVLEEGDDTEGFWPDQIVSSASYEWKPQ